MFESRLSKKFKIKKTPKTLEPNEIFLDTLAQKKEEEMGISNQRREIQLSRNKFLALFSFFSLFIIFLFVSSFYYQIIRNDDFKVLANQNQYITNYLTASRGVIYDNSGNQLVSNKVIFNLYIETEKTSKKDLKTLADILKQDIDSDSLFLIENIDIETLILIESFNFPFVYYEQSLIREYKDPEIFSHIIGYIGKISQQELAVLPEYSLQDYVGKMGIEKYYDNYLKKIPGKVLIERDSLGNILSEKKVSDSQPGYNLELWIDAELQVKLYTELEKTMNQVGSVKASAIAIDPRTGGILALVSLPGFNNNFFSDNNQKMIQQVLQDPQKPLFNRAISGLYAVGSTIKPLTGLAALQENIISSEKKIDCKGQINISHQYNPEITYTFRDLRVHGLTDIQKAIAESCNVYFYTIGGGYEQQKGLGVNKIKEYLEYFGWSKKTNIDLPGEQQGFIPYPEWKQEVKKENWWTGDTYNLSIGQGDIGITPLQVVNSFSIIANKGTLYSPKIVKNISDQDKNIIKEIKPEIISQDLFLEKNIEIIRQGMRKAVTGIGAPNASATILQSLPVTCAAKTGTAQTPKNDLYHNWITVFAPYDNPEIVLTVLIEEVQGLQLASSVVAKETLEWYFKEYDY
ncbi:MAG: penicillin-binding protein 2 [Candidatus Pacebacteria bacterium]|nr:penicillin-binding protein 2 [Candidatus Paceibacterota bacterium]